MPALLPPLAPILLALVALATPNPVLGQAQEKSRADNIRAGQAWLLDVLESGRSSPADDPGQLEALNGRWFLDDANGQPIPCKRTSPRGGFELSKVWTVGHFFTCGNVALKQSASNWELIDRTGKKFVLNAKGEVGGTRMTIRLDGGWGGLLYLVGTPEPAKVIPAPAIR